MPSPIFKWLSLLLGTLLFSFSLFAQSDTSTYQRQPLDPTQIDFLYSYYEQNGSHSAVTGGVGNQHLIDHAPTVIVQMPLTPTSGLSMELGADILTSASTDRIDFELSSASKHDIRTHVDVGYNYTFPKQRLTVGTQISGSMESDYASMGWGGSVSQQSKDGNRNWGVQVQTFFDNLQWGWLDEEQFFTPQKLIYPQELRDTVWSPTIHRNSYSLSGNLTQVINQRLQIGISGDIVHQSGLLATPFHRVFLLRKKEPVVERLPDQRWKYALGLRLNYFWGDRLIIRIFNRFYTDDFGIQSWTSNVELPVKIGPVFSIYPLWRWHTQRGSEYFQPYRKHSLNAEFYTSDYDLSTFNSWQAGLGLRVGLFRSIGWPRLVLSTLDLRYAHYVRTDGLQADIFSLALSMQLFRKQRPNLISN